MADSQSVPACSGGAGGDEADDEVVTVQPATAVGEQAGACFEGMDAVGAGTQRVAELAGIRVVAGFLRVRAGRPGRRRCPGMRTWRRCAPCSWR